MVPALCAFCCIRSSGVVYEMPWKAASTTQRDGRVGRSVLEARISFWTQSIDLLDLFGGSSGRVGALREGEAKYWELRSLRDCFAVNEELPSKVVKLTREVAVVISRLDHNVLDAVATLEDGSGQTAQANTWTSLGTHEATITGLAVHVARALANQTTAARHFGDSLLELAEQARDADAGLASISGELQRLWSQYEAGYGRSCSPVLEVEEVDWGHRASTMCPWC